MFETAIAQETNSDQQCLDFLDLFKEFRRTVIAYSKTPAAYDLTRLRKLESKVDALWAKLTDSQKSSLAQALLQRNLLPEEVGELIKTFNAKIVRIR